MPAAAVIAAISLSLTSPIARCDEPVSPDAGGDPHGSGARSAPNPLGAKAVGTQALAKRRAGTDHGPFSEMKLLGGVSDNRASNLMTGNNVIADGALSGVSGVPLVVQNSGNNVLIQSATIINVQIK